MALRLTIENVTSLPDGGPISFTVTGRRSIDIGRDQHLDWTLPDPTRYISGKHCEIHYRNNSYWLHDVSTNGTFLNGSDQRMRSPYELKNGDRLVIGHYVVAAVVDDEAGSVLQQRSTPANAARPEAPVAYPELWSSDREVPPPVDRHQVMAPREAARPVNPDFLDWAAGVPEADPSPAPRRPPTTRADGGADMDWASGAPLRAVDTFEPAPPIAAPRRPVWKDDEAAGSGTSPFLPPQPAQPAPRTPPDPPQNLPRRFQPEPPQTASAPPALTAPAASMEIAGHDFVRRIAQAAGLPEEFFTGTDSARLADQLGELMRISVSNLMTLLQARNEAKRLTRSTTHTTIQATENNPLKFSPTPEDAMRILFGPKTHSYMEARRAFEQGFHDLKIHQLKTYAAMQHAVSMLVADLDPSSIMKDVEELQGTLDRIRPRKSRLWDAFLMRWKASFGREAGAAIEAFMLHFADYYDQNDRNDSR
jgi:type VI secretion system protein ImpI